MRLTLRNMLAYMDNLLDTEASQVIAKKIEESEFASGLQHRIHDVMRRTRLGAPSVMDNEGGLDPNTMAEYIGTTLPTARVADFEKVCLESDIHLAEVAACHQVLALVLGEPAEVEPSCRERMYRLAAPHDAAKEEPPQHVPAPPPLQDADPPVSKLGHPPKAKLSVPSYLQASRRNRRLWTIAGIATVLLLGFALLAATSQFKSGFLARGMFGVNSTENQADRSLPISGRPEPIASDEIAAEPPAQEPIPPEPGQLTPPAQEPIPPEPGQLTPPAQEPIPSEPKPRQPGQLTPHPTDTSTSTGMPVDATPRVPADITAMNDDRLQPRPTAVASVGQKPTLPDNDPGLNMPSPSAVVPKAQPPAPGPPLELGQAAGQFSDEDQVLLRFESETGWRRLAAGTELAFGDQLLSFPAFRPTISIAERVKITLIDGTRLQLTAGDKNQPTAGVTVNYGRAIIKCSSDGGCSLRLNAGDIMGIVTFGSAESKLAVEVARRPGSTVDPETQPASFVVTLYAASGECRWQDAGGEKPVRLDPPARLILTGQTDQVVQDAGGATWIVFDTTDILDRRASKTIEQDVTVDSPVLLRLQELADDRRLEVRWLALDCLAWMGEFEQLVAMLNDREQRLGWWADYIHRLRTAVLRDPATAAAVRSEMERQYGVEGADLYEMLWGYGPHELDNEQAARLVRYLEHQKLAFRVMSFTTLYEITGFGNSYDPNKPPADQQRSIERWKDRLKDGFKPKRKTG